MADYKRKKVKKVSKPKETKPKKETVNVLDESTEEYINESEDEKIKVKRKRSSYKTKNENLLDELRVIESKKTERKKPEVFKTFAALLVVFAIIFCISAALPIGIMDSVSSFFRTLGSGDYPVQYNGSLVKDIVNYNSYYVVLNDTSVSAYNTNGKEIFNHIHGFSNPVMSCSSSRIMVFDQNGYSVNIYNLSGLLKSFETDEKIINGSICRNGSYVLSTSGGEYTSVVTVYSESNTKLYTWNSAKDIVNNAVLSSNGKKLAVSCLRVLGGVTTSNLSVFEFASADPVFTYDLGNVICLGIRAVTNGFGCMTESGCDYFTWRKYEHLKITSENRTLSSVRHCGNDTVLVFNRESDKSDNYIYYLSSSGKVTGEFDYKGVITDIEFKNGKIYFISDTNLSVYSKNGEMINSMIVEYGYKRFAVISSNSVAAFTDEYIKEISVK